MKSQVEKFMSRRAKGRDWMARFWDRYNRMLCYSIETTEYDYDSPAKCDSSVGRALVKAFS